MALAIAVIISGAVFSIIPKSFDALGGASASVREVREMLAFDAILERDFSSIAEDCGFAGDASSCAFWTMAQSNDGKIAPALVEYRRKKGIVSRLKFPLQLYMDFVGTNTPSVSIPDTAGESPSRQPIVTEFHVDAGRFKYGSLQDAVDGAGSEVWSSATNAPAMIMYSWQVGQRGAKPRFICRRSLP